MSDEKEVVQKTYEERIKAINVICQPLACKKSTKKLHKLVKKATSAKKKNQLVRRGVKEVVKGVRKGEKGLAILAGDICPLDVISHIPILLEEAGIPYLFVPSKQDLGAAANTRRPTSCVLIKAPSSSGGGGGDDDFDGRDIYRAMMQEAKKYDPANI